MKHLEPPAWLYKFLARGPVNQWIYRGLAADLSGTLQRGARVLDVGTGPGHLLGMLARERPDLHLVGLDVDDRMIRLARQEHSCPPSTWQWVVGDALHLPFREGSFDQVVTSFSFHIWKDLGDGLQGIRGALRPGGRAWIYEMNREASRADVQRFSRELRLPFFLVYPVFKALSSQHALRPGEFAEALRRAGGAEWGLSPSHYIFWRGELRR